MNPFKKMIDNHRHKVCVTMFNRIENTLKDSTSKTAIVYVGSLKGYDELFEKFEEMGWYYETSGDNREGIWLTVKSNVFKPDKKEE